MLRSDCVLGLMAVPTSKAHHAYPLLAQRLATELDVLVSSR